MSSMTTASGRNGRTQRSLLNGKSLVLKDSAAYSAFRKRTANLGRAASVACQRTIWRRKNKSSAQSADARDAPAVTDK